MNPIKPLFVAILLVAGAVAQADVGLEKLATLNDSHRESTKKLIAKFKESLPEGYAVGIDLEPSQTGKLAWLRITPLTADGKPDGEAQVQVHNIVVHRIPYKNGLKHGLEVELQPHKVNNKQTMVPKSETPWVDGKIHGVRKSYHPNGKLMLEVPHEKGKRHGTSRAYDLPGRVQKETVYENGKREGEMIEYWPATGKHKKVVPYRGGSVDGTVREYYDNGQPKREIPVTNESFHGIEKQYNEDGKVVKTRYWIEDEPVSASKFKRRFK